MATKYGGLGADQMAEIMGMIFDGAGFMRFTHVWRYGGRTERVSCRPVALKNGVDWQFEYGAGSAIRVANLSLAEARETVSGLLARGGECDIHVQTGGGDLHVRVTRKGRVLSSRSKPLQRQASVLPHDRQKRQPLNEFDAAALLQGLGVAGADGQIRASMRGKYDQINAFLRIMDATLEGGDQTLEIVDYGCGKAYLTFAAYFYLTMAKGCTVRVRGVDRNGAVVEGARRLAADAGPEPACL